MHVGCPPTPRESGGGVPALPLPLNTRTRSPSPATGLAADRPATPGRPAIGRRSAVLAPRARAPGSSALSGPGHRSGAASRGARPPPALPGAAGTQQAGRRQGGRGQARHPEEARAAGIRPMARPGAAARRRQECPARAQVASCPPPAPGPDPGASAGGRARDPRVPGMRRLEVAPVALPFQTSDPLVPNARCYRHPKNTINSQ